MKRTERIIGIIAFVSIILNLNLVPLGSTLSVISLSCLSVFYMYLGSAIFCGVPLQKVFIKESYAGYSNRRKSVNVMIGMIISATLVGILFKLQGWPNASFLLQIGSGGLLISALIYFIKVRDKNPAIYSNVINRIAIVAMFAFIFMLTPKEKLLEFKYSNHPEYVKAVKKAWADPDNQALWKKVEEESLKIYKEK